MSEYVQQSIEVPVVLTFEIECHPEERDWVISEAIQHLSVGIWGADINHGGYSFRLTERKVI